jgi:hypothetical protein
MQTRRVSIFVLVLVAAITQIGSFAAPAGAATKSTPPDACALITSADVATAFAKLDPALQPTSVTDPVRGKPANQGGQGTNSCSTAFYLPNSVGGSVLVKANKIVKGFPCPPKGQPGKTVKIGATKARLEPVPSNAAVTRDITFVQQGGCTFLEIFLSGGDAHVPASAFVELATDALAKKPGATPAATTTTG